MIRAIFVQPDVPENYQEIIVAYSEAASKRGKSGIMYQFSDMLLVSLRQMPLANRYRAIKQICSNLEESLLQSSRNPNDVKVTEI